MVRVPLADALIEFGVEVVVGPGGEALWVGSVHGQKRGQQLDGEFFTRLESARQVHDVFELVDDEVAVVGTADVAVAHHTGVEQG